MDAAPLLSPGPAPTPDRRTTLSMDRMGGVAALLIAAGYVAIMPLFALVGAPPEGAPARVEYHATGTAAWWGIVSLSVLTDLLLLPLAGALYLALRRLGQPEMLVATLFTLTFVVLDLAVLWPAKVALIQLGEQAAIATDAQRSLLVAAASYPAAVLDSVLVPVYSVLTLGIGILVTSLVMLRAGRSAEARRPAEAGRPAALVGVVTGLLSVGSVVETAISGTFPVLVVVTSLLTIVWLVLVGLGLLRGTWAGVEPAAPLARDVTAP
jgi:hypothetical protein